MKVAELEEAGVTRGDVITITGEVVQCSEVKEGNFGPWRKLQINDGTGNIGYLWNNPSDAEWGAIKGKTVTAEGTVRAPYKGIPQFAGDKVNFGGSAPAEAPSAPSGGQLTDTQLLEATARWVAALAQMGFVEGTDPMAACVNTLSISATNGRIAIDGEELPF